MIDLRNNIAVLGIGYVGLPLTAALASVGFKVIGVDINKERVDMLKRGEVPFYEPGMKETLDNHRDNIEYTTDSDSAIKRSDTIFVTVGTPLDENDNPDYRSLDNCISNIGKNLRKNQLIILKSTVIVGTTEGYVAPKLEKLSGLKAGEDFYLVFCPERSIEGLALHEIYNLTKIVGGINEKSSELAEKVIKKLGGNITRVSSPRVSEMSKLVDNLYRSNNIAFANELAVVCEKLGIKANEVVSAVNNSYPRTKIFSPGLGADGPCLSKDPKIFRYAALKNNVKTPVTDGCIIQNEMSTLRVSDLVKEYIKKNNLSGINLSMIGLAFKGFPETDDLRGSPALKILNELKKSNIKLTSVKLYDPLVKKFPGYIIRNSMSEAIKDSDVILFLTNHPRLMNLEVEFIEDLVKDNSIIIDAWGNINLNKKINKFNYFRIGHGEYQKSNQNINPIIFSHDFPI